MTTENKDKAEVAGEFDDKQISDLAKRVRKSAPNRPEILVRFGKWIEDQRRTKRSKETDEPLTQGEVANLAGTSRVNYSNIENGVAGVSYEMVQKLARALDLDETECLIRAGFNPGIMEALPLAWLEMNRLPAEAQKLVLESMKAQIEAARKLYPDAGDNQPESSEKQ